MLRHLSEEEMRATLRRATEIATQAPAVSAEDELETYLKAAEEAGLPRAAVLQALRERLILPGEEIRPGDLVFAPSVDGAAYVAVVERLDGGMARVRFVHGGDHSLAVSDLRPLGFVPGRKIEVKADFGWTGATLTAFHAAKRQVEVELWGERKKYALERVRLKLDRPQLPPTTRHLLFRAALIAGGLGTGLGFLLGHLFR